MFSHLPLIKCKRNMVPSGPVELRSQRQLTNESCGGGFCVQSFVIIL